MKIKNILHNAALRGWLLALALILAVTASAEKHFPTNPQPTGSTVADNLVAFSGTLSISYTDEFQTQAGGVGDGVEKNTYYDNNTWYNKTARTLTDSNGNKRSYLLWKKDHIISFKLGDGQYKLTLSYNCNKDGRGIWVYPGTSRPESEDEGYFEKAIFDGEKVFTLAGGQCWSVEGADGDCQLRSIKVEKLETPTAPELEAITEPYFWYYNGGNDFGKADNGYPWGEKNHYRHLPNNNGNINASHSTSDTDGNTKYVYVNGSKVCGTNNGNGELQYGSYIFENGDAIGFKLGNGDYRIKVYLLDRGDESANRVLFKGVNVATAARVDNNVYQTQINYMGDNGVVDSGTRLVTYEIDNANGDVYWIKNALGDNFYLGGFEVLPKEYPGFADTFTGESWYVDGHKNTKSIALLGADVDYAVSGDNVVLYGPAMALNATPINGKSVMLNKGNRIGVSLKAGATLEFSFIADAGVEVRLSDENGSKITKFTGDNGFKKATYEAETAKKIWITGETDNYVYISGFEVTVPDQPEEKDPMDEANPISQDYVWYPVRRGHFTNGDFSDESKTVFIYKDFHHQNETAIHDNKHNKETYHLHGKEMIAYRVDKTGTQIGFKIAANKKGVINCYYPVGDSDAAFPLYQSSNPASLGNALDRITGTMDQTAGTDRAITYAQYYFDTTGGEKTFWLKADNNTWFGGMEVLFDEGNNGGQTLAKDVEYTIAGTETITNALSSDTYSAIKSTTAAPVAGPSMILCPDLAANTVMTYKRGDHRNGIMVKIPGDCKAMRVKGYLNDASIRIYRGTASAPDASAYEEVTGSGVVDKTVMLNSLEGVSGDVYWISTNKEAGAYLTSVTPMEGINTLQPTDVNYIYKVNGVPSTANNGVQSSGGANGRIMFIDDNGPAWSNSGAKMKVLGTEVAPVAIENGTDFFAVKVDKSTTGVKTGYVKVYFNGGSSASHKMEELPLDQPLYSGWNSSYDPATQTVTFPGEGGGRGWWFGQEGEGARDLSAYNKINIELGKITGSPTLQLVVQSANGASARFQVDSRGRLLGDLTDQSKWYANSETGATFDITKIAQIYIQDNNTDATSATVEIKSARLMNKPIVIATDTDQDPANGYTEVFGGKIYDLPDGKLYEYPFDLSKASTVPQLIWITGAGAGTTNIAAIEVLYDSEHAKVVEWYVNKDTKMIVGSEDPNFTMKFHDETLTYPAGYDEYVTFYMSSGRQANVSFIMPEAVREVYDWEQAVKAAEKYIVKYVKEEKDKNGNKKTTNTEYIDEALTDAAIPAGMTKLADTYGKHTLEIYVDKKKDGANKSPTNVRFNGDGKNNTVTTKYDRNAGQTAAMNKIDNTLYAWYGYSYDLPSAVEDYYDSNGKLVEYDNQDFYAEVSVTATQKKDGDEKTIDVVDNKDGQWKILMRFVAFKAPEAVASVNGSVTDKVTVTAGQTGDIYYTVDSSEPENLADNNVNENQSTTEKYDASKGVDVSKLNCIFKAAQYIETPVYFYEDISKGKGVSGISNVMKVVSNYISINNENPSVVYVKNNDTSDKGELFNQQEGGYMLTIPTGNQISGEGEKHEQAYSANPLMYLTLGGKDQPCLASNGFEMNGTNWKASKDGGLKTYLDSYQYKFDVDGVANPEWWKNSEGITVSGNQNQNPMTECNGGPGGEYTENGGMFLLPIAGTMLRFEPEYDGVITVWLRQNGCLDNNTQESGTFTRRPVFVMDENGRVMRRSTIRPTAAHYMGINGVWAINSSVCEQRSQVEYTWLFEVAKQVYENHPLYANRFGADFPNRWETLGQDHSGHILYGWWYKGFDLNATRSQITSAAHVSRFEYMEPELLYRSDNIYNMEMNRLGLERKFSKYGFELPNFQYVQYRIPVKAGKTYFITGRGTKNGFSAIRFDALAPNTNLSTSAMEDLRYTDNPAVTENQTEGDNYLKVTNDWDNNGKRYYKSTETSPYDLTGKSESDVVNAYNALTPKTLYDSGIDNSTTINDIVNEGKTGKDYDTDGNLVGKTINFTLNRTFRAGNWHPIILPFSLSETRVEQYFGEGTVVLYLDPYVHTQTNKVDEATGNSWTSALKPALEGTKLSFTIHRYQMLYANTPAFICPTFTWSDNKKKSPVSNYDKPNVVNGAVSGITFKRVTLDGSNSHNSLGGGYYGYAISNDYEVVGSFDQTTQTGDIYYVNNTDPTGGFNSNMAELVHSENKTVTMKGFRVWIRLIPGRSGAPIKTVGSRGFSDFEEDSEMTGISDIVADDYTIEGYDIEDDGVYDLLGRKIGQGSLEGLQKGVYIFHGRKVYVR